MINHRFARFAWGLLGFTLLVIVWGAVVRATGSGAGCGSHWPSCQGAVIPPDPTTETIIEFVHRLTSGTMGLGAVVLFAWAFRKYPGGHPVRKGSFFSLLFTITEGLVGAWLVLAELTAENSSAARAISIAVHLVNTLLLIASLSLTAWWASGGARLDFSAHRKSIPWFTLAWLGMAVLGITGAITALGDTLFPSVSLSQGLAQDLSPTAHFLIRLRIIHPIIAVLVGVYLSGLALILRRNSTRPLIRRLALSQIGFFGVQIIVGVTNVLLLAPVAMQLIHLLVTDLIWINLVILSAAHFSKPAIESDAEVAVLPGQLRYREEY